MFISSKLNTYVIKGWMSCISGGTSCRLPRRFSYECWSLWVGEEKRATSDFGWKWFLEGLFLFQVPEHCIYLMELYPSYPRITLLGNFVDQYWYITNPCATFLFGFHAHSLFHWHTWKIGGNTWGGHYLECHYHHTKTWQPWWHAATSTKNNYFLRVGHDHPQSQQL